MGNAENCAAFCLPGLILIYGRKFAPFTAFAPTLETPLLGVFIQMLFREDTPSTTSPSPQLWHMWLPLDPCKNPVIGINKSINEIYTHILCNVLENLLDFTLARTFGKIWKAPCQHLNTTWGVPHMVNRGAVS